MTNLLLHKLNKYQIKLEQNPNNTIYQRKIDYYVNLIGGTMTKEINLTVQYSVYHVTIDYNLSDSSKIHSITIKFISSSPNRFTTNNIGTKPYIIYNGGLIPNNNKYSGLTVKNIYIENGNINLTLNSIRFNNITLHDLIYNQNPPPEESPQMRKPYRLTYKI
jgi:hypothetical protein